MDDSFGQHLQQQLSELFNTDFKIKENRQVFGGDINTTYIITTNQEQYFVKCNNSASTEMFAKEYNGLQLLRSKSNLQIPEPFLYGEHNSTSYLAMECIEETPFTPKAWQSLGEGLAAMHKQTAPQFGLEENNYIGSLAQLNSFSNTWEEFYAEQRILPLIRKAFNTALCTKEDVKDAETVCNKFSSIFPEEPPALLHGDLWSGNVMACVGDNAAIYDPAVYYGHREMDIGLSLLFGGFESSFYHHYNGNYPLQNGWRERVALCQLYPLLVHLNLFGSGYYGRVKSVLSQYK